MMIDSLDKWFESYPLMNRDEQWKDYRCEKNG